VSVFLDTSVILAGLIDFGPQSAPAQTLMHAVAEKRIPQCATAWHCCLEFYSVATRLPPEFRIAPADALTLLEEEVFARMAVHELPASHRLPMLRAAAHDAVAGGHLRFAHRRRRTRRRSSRGRDRQPSSFRLSVAVRPAGGDAIGVSGWSQSQEALM
jgi:hypothetical protein